MYMHLPFCVLWFLGLSWGRSLNRLDSFMFLKCTYLAICVYCRVYYSLSLSSFPMERYGEIMSKIVCSAFKMRRNSFEHVATSIAQSSPTNASYEVIVAHKFASRQWGLGSGLSTTPSDMYIRWSAFFFYFSAEQVIDSITIGDI